MSLISLGESGTDLVPAQGTPPGHRRRYLSLAGAVLAFLLAGGSAVYLLVAGTQAANHPLVAPVAPGATGQPAAIGPSSSGVSGPPDVTPDSGSPTTGGSPAPTMPAASMAAAAHGGPYRVSGPLCAVMDLTPIQKLGGGAGTTRSDHTDRVLFGDFMCSASFGPGGRVWMSAEVRIFPTASAAMASYATDRAGTVRVPGLGASAAQLLAPGAGYVLLVTDGNLEMRLQVGAVGPKPSAEELRQPAIDTANRTLARLRT